MKQSRNSMRIDDKELTVSVGVLGNPGTGKSAILHKYI